MTVFRQSSIFLAIVLLVFGVSGVVAQSNQRDIDPKNFDTTVSPCQNFYQFANGNWLKNNPIPAAYPYWGTAYELIQRNSDLLKEILESSAANTNAPRGTNLQKIGDFYAIAMDTIKIENDGMAPLKKDLDRIAAITTIQDLQRVITEFHNEGLGMV
ncbi:MAG: M13 family metallopeptidase N-terminal domain-containing protein, partial [candidate division Zixibacteria bacterium]|nr:M13 family metallopeptidase N-terminal domain-containing protein [candidate division Zixibacteria bacterium]